MTERIEKKIDNLSDTMTSGFGRLHGELNAHIIDDKDMAASIKVIEERIKPSSPPGSLLGMPPKVWLPLAIAVIGGPQAGIYVQNRMTETKAQEMAEADKAAEARFEKKKLELEKARLEAEVEHRKAVLTFDDQAIERAEAAGKMAQAKADEVEAVVDETLED